MYVCILHTRNESSIKNRFTGSYEIRVGNLRDDAQIKTYLRICPPPLRPSSFFSQTFGLQERGAFRKILRYTNARRMHRET